MSEFFELTLDEVDVSLAPGVAMLGSEDADRLCVGLKWRAANPLQLDAELIGCQWSSITVVHVQHKELIQEEEIWERLSQGFHFQFTIVGLPGVMLTQKSDKI